MSDLFEEMGFDGAPSRWEAERPDDFDTPDPDEDDELDYDFDPDYDEE